MAWRAPGARLLHGCRNRNGAIHYSSVRPGLPHRPPESEAEYDVKTLSGLPIKVGTHKTLVLVRHAKTRKSDLSLPDRERALSERGRKQLMVMGKRLARSGCKVDLIVTSPALRALATARALARMLGYRRKDLVIDEQLYACQANDLLRIVQHLDDELQSVLLVGHNPQLSELAHRFRHDITHLPTCAVAVFRFDVRCWSEVGSIAPTAVSVDCPRKKSQVL